MLPDTGSRRDWAFYGRASALRSTAMGVMWGNTWTVPDAEPFSHPVAANDNTPLPFSALLKRKSTAWFTWPIRRIAQTVLSVTQAWLARQRLKQALLAMDRAQLADIGLTREDIPAVVRGDFVRSLETDLPLF